MKSKQEQKVAEEMGPHLEDDEHVQAVLIARPRGFTQTMAGSLQLGAAQQGKNKNAAEQAGFALASPGAIVLTNNRLLSVETGEALGMGIGGGVKGVLSAVPLSDVDEIKVKRLLLGSVVTLKVRGEEFKLEANQAAGAKPLREAFEQAKAMA